MTEDTTTHKIANTTSTRGMSNVTYLTVEQISVPTQTSVKGIKTFTLDLDEYELVETGSKEKEKDGKKIPVAYMKFRKVNQ